jgi:hypothetical protein
VSQVTRQNLLLSDFPKEHHSWIEPLIRAVNDLNGGAADAVNGGLTFADNFNGFITTVPSIQSFPVRFQVKAGVKPVGVLIVDAQDLTSKGQPKISLSHPAWSVVGDQVVVTGISGTTAGYTYTITFMVLGG